MSAMGTGLGIVSGDEPQLEAQLAEGAELDAEIRKNLRGLGYGK